MTIAVDLVIEGIQEPVRFLVETRAKIFPTGERFWYFTTKPHVEQFILKLKEVCVFCVFNEYLKIITRKLCKIWMSLCGLPHCWLGKCIIFLYCSAPASQSFFGKVLHPCQICCVENKRMETEGKFFKLIICLRRSDFRGCSPCINFYST